MDNNDKRIHIAAGLVDRSMTRQLVDAWFAAEPAAQLVKSAAAGVAALLPLLTDDGQPLDHERFAVVALDRRCRVIDAAVLTSGSDGFTVVDPRQVFRWALTRPGRRPTVAILVGHNHPSGDPTPSAEDRDVTQRLVTAGSTLGIKVIDHIVIGGAGSFTSLLELGLLPE